MNDQQSTPNLHHMTCCTCGEYAGKFEQWWNRDTGYGLCADCRDWLSGPRPKGIGYSSEEMRDLYGIEGRHYPARAPAQSESP